MALTIIAKYVNVLAGRQPSHSCIACSSLPKLQIKEQRIDLAPILQFARKRQDVEQAGTLELLIFAIALPGSPLASHTVQVVEE
jgi:hypothetical protein